MAQFVNTNFGRFATEVIIPDGETSIPDRKYYQNSYLREIFIPDSVQSIGERAFYECTMIENVYIPASVEYIGEYAFARCRNLKEVNIPENCKYEKSTFVNCSPDLQILRYEVASSVKADKSDCIPGAKVPETDYRQLFLESVYAEGIPAKEKLLDGIFDEDVKIPVAVYFFTKYNSSKARDYISRNFQKIMHYLVDRNDMAGMSAVMSIQNK
ncbi:MAG: leucine-rich repeat domain-containing protein [Ruminococcus flavefaciens]|nr:leucine-rich repeat domain-containing protein [Ruminococcus flavefaciens]